MKSSSPVTRSVPGTRLEIKTPARETLGVLWSVKLMVAGIKLALSAGEMSAPYLTGPEFTPMSLTIIRGSTPMEPLDPTHLRQFLPRPC